LVNGNGLLFKTQDYKDLAQQVLKLVKDEELRRKMGEASSKNIQQYDIHKSVELLEKVYYKVLEEKQDVLR